MIHYMKNHLAFEDESEDLEIVMNQLMGQMKVHSGDDIIDRSYVSLKHIKRTRTK